MTSSSSPSPSTDTEATGASTPLATDSLEFVIPDELAGERLDVALTRLLPSFSRSRIQHWIKTGEALVDGQPAIPKRKVRAGECVQVSAAPAPAVDLTPEPIELEVVHADAQLLVINKPAGMVVHPGAGNPNHTLVNALLHYDPALAAVPRAGVVHRLDKNTTGLLVVARTLEAHKHLVDELAERQITRQYDAVVRGVLTGGGTVDAPIGRHPGQRTRMCVQAKGREARSHYRIRQRFAAHTLVSVQLETGRTHQIRVHMAHIGHPLVGDPVYGGRLGIPAGATPRLETALRSFSRQALHAARLELTHPASGERSSFESPWPIDLQQLISVLATEHT